MTTALSTGEIARMVERADAHAWRDFARAAPEPLRDALGIRLYEYGSVVAAMAARVDVLAMNRVINYGIDDPGTDHQLNAIVHDFRAAAVPRFFLQLSPAARPPEAVDWLTERGFSLYNNWVKLYAPARTLSPVGTNLRVEEVRGAESVAFAAIVTSAFGMPEVVRPWIVASIGRAGWRHYLAYDGPVPVATAALFVSGRLGWLGFASTSQGYRRRGAQSALIARRLHDASNMGCAWIIAETAEETQGHPAPSFHNLRRLGFEVAYVRPNYLWSAAGKV